MQRTKLFFFFLFILTYIALEARAAPFVPEDGAQVLERLRERPLDASARELRRLRAALAADPHNLALALRVAQRYIEKARGDADPRYLGYAEAALAPWWALPRPPDRVLVLRATIRQSNHDFPGALQDLALVLKSNPRDAQALLTHATILQVTGDYAQAQESCERLSRLTALWVGAACAAHIASMTGKADEAYRTLNAALEQNPAAPAAEKAWIETSLAELALRLGRPVEAEAHFKRALRQQTADPYLTAAYADFLLDAGRPAEVRALIPSDTRIDALLLRLALADRALGSRELGARVAMLEARFAAARARGYSVHQREEARFRLHLAGEPREALRLARENWEAQKETADARILLEAAAAADEPAAARPVLDWMRRNRVEDVVLRKLVERLGHAA